MNIRDFTTFCQQTLTRDQFLERLHFLENLEEECYDKGEEFNSKSLLELSALVTLVTKDKNEILFTELVTVDPNSDEYYYVQFCVDKGKKIKESIHKYVAIQDIQRMQQLLGEDEEYKALIADQMNSSFLDAIDAQKSSHRHNKKAIKRVKRLESLHPDAITGDIYPAIYAVFHKIFHLYKQQKNFNHGINAQILNILSVYRHYLESESSNNFPEDREQIRRIIHLRESFEEAASQMKETLSEAFRKINQEFLQLSLTHIYQAFILSVDSTRSSSEKYLASSPEGVFSTSDQGHYNKVYNIMERTIRKGICFNMNGCVSEAVWKIQRIEMKALEMVGYALAAISCSVQSMMSNWETRIEFINKSELVQSSFYPSESKKWGRNLDRLIFLHATCMQNEKYSGTIDCYWKRELDLLSKPIVKMSGGGAYTIQNSLSHKFLSCRGEEVKEGQNKKSLKVKISEIAVVEEEKGSSRIIWELIDGGIGTVKIRNMATNQHLTCLVENARRAKIMGSSDLASEKRSIGLPYQGLWKIVKIEDILAEIQKGRRGIKSVIS